MHEDDQQPIHESKHQYSRQESMNWWPIYEKIKLRKKERSRAEGLLNTGGAKLSEVRWPKDTCAVAKRARAVTFCVF